MRQFFSFLTVFLSATLTINCNAGLITRNSEFGSNTITFDSDTYTEWLQPFETVFPSGQASGDFQSYYDVLAQTQNGGTYDGWRFATRGEINTFLFSSAGITSAGSMYGVSYYDAAAIAGLISHVDYTFGQGDDIFFSRILDAVFQDDDGRVGRTIISYSSYLGEPSNGRVIFSTLSEDQNQKNTAPYGGWLVRVPEPGSLSLLAAGVTGLIWSRRARRLKAGRASVDTYV